LSQRGFPEPPGAAVQDGRFELGRYCAPFPRANLLDIGSPNNYPIPRFLKNFRLKEWQAFQFGDERWFFFTALYNAKTFGIANFFAYDRVGKKRYGCQRVLPGSPFRFFEELSLSRVTYHGATTFIEYVFDLEAGKIGINVDRHSRDLAKRFSGQFDFSYGAKVSAPSAVCLPLGMNRAMYSMKVLMPVTGEFTSVVGSSHLENPGAMGILDEHKGFYPWRLRYDWVTGFGLDSKGRRVGFNLTDNQVKDQVRYNENCIWINNKVWPLPPVKVTRPKGPASEWFIQDTEGLVDLVFIPEVPNDIIFNIGIMRSDYHGPFGSFRGVIKNGEGDKIEAERLYGAGEQKYLRA